MSKKKSKTAAVATRFMVDMPDRAPALGFDPQAEHFSWRDVLPSNYWNLDLLEERIEQLGGNPVLTPSHIVIQPVIDPEQDEDKQDLSPKIVLHFVENSPALVFNKTRCGLAQKITGTPNPRLWADKLPALELYPGVNRDFSMSQQVLFRPVATDGPAKQTVSDINDDLFA